MINPTRNNVLIKREAAKKETASGIILKSTEEPDLGVVLSAGVEVEHVSVNDRVLVDWNRATDLQDDDKYIIAEEHIIAIID